MTHAPRQLRLATIWDEKMNWRDRYANGMNSLAADGDEFTSTEDHVVDRFIPRAPLRGNPAQAITSTFRERKILPFDGMQTVAILCALSLGRALALQPFPAATRARRLAWHRSF